MRFVCGPQSYFLQDLLPIHTQLFASAFQSSSTKRGVTHLLATVSPNRTHYKTPLPELLLFSSFNTASLHTSMAPTTKSHALAVYSCHSHWHFEPHLFEEPTPVTKPWYMETEVGYRPDILSRRIENHSFTNKLPSRKSDAGNFKPAREGFMYEALVASIHSATTMCWSPGSIA